ncbi:hypothetical protein FHX06_000694 [Rhizobium sp. BK512]|uniref:hypothetical protein n=1 Tax=Rhizobium sp. BK512 TaxID=2587010 RepID=UPI0016104A36|nr:hypothetical protein [Rhizobium sp. BK512]MBB3559397.1 hypothetical protein [Rhizobium sp. BK512]
MTEYPSDIDYIWVATDKDGFLAIFVTGGAGAIPLSALQDIQTGSGELEAIFFQLPAISEVNLLVNYPRPDDFVTMAERGFFTYDWRDVHRVKRDHSGKYEKITAPQKPIRIGNVPPFLQILAHRTIFNHSFLSADAISIEDNFKFDEFIAIDS